MPCRDTYEYPCDAVKVFAKQMDAQVRPPPPARHAARAVPPARRARRPITA